LSYTGKAITMARTIADMLREARLSLANATQDEKDFRRESKRIIDSARAEGRSALTPDETKRFDDYLAKARMASRARQAAEANVAELVSVEAEESESDRLANITRDNGVKLNSGDSDRRVTVTNEPRTYSRDKDTDGKGTAFITDVIAAYRGNPQANERLARHAREYEVDHNGLQTRAAGDVTSGSLPNLIVPQYLVNEYAAKPSNARPFADICHHVDLPPDGMKVELAKGNTTSTAALQTNELVAAGGGNFATSALELSVQTAEAWQLVSRQSIDRGRVSESVVMQDMLAQMDALIDSTLITQTTTGLFDSGTRIVYDSAAPLVTELYPLILAGASKVSQALLNRGKPTHVIMHPRRWYWLQSLFSSTWPLFSQPGIGNQMAGANTANAYGDGVAGYLPCGLAVVIDNNVPTTALTTAQTGGTQDILFVVPQNECVLLESPGREVFIRAEAPAANQLGVLLVAYSYFTYTFQRYATTAFQRINGTGTVPPSGGF
jgi:hypothetical protein